MTFRQAQTIDAREVMTIIEEAQAYFKGAGIDQWQNGYPNLEVIEADIQKGKSYVLVRDGQIVASAALSFNDERTYDKIYEGRWLSEGSYGVIHRIAVKDTCKGCGVAGILFEALEVICKEEKVASIKVDTHEDNQSMQRLLEKLGYKYCGIIYLQDGNKRVAFEKCIA